MAENGDETRDCIRCGIFVFFHYRHCVSCGMQNPYFAEKEFENQTGVTIDTMSASCGTNGHPEIFEILEGDPKFIYKPYFCFVCGAQIT